MRENYEPPLRGLQVPRHSNGHCDHLFRILHRLGVDQKLEERRAVFGSYVAMVSSGRLGLV